ncbi:hypothetical protein [Streptomyces sp. bgisy060]|uniref:hypothetical protein n=1 Tax=Streptomyces sp. bgisy060 TaxID=3413775 RepID=UPI003EBBFC98
MDARPLPRLAALLGAVMVAATALTGCAEAGTEATAPGRTTGPTRADASPAPSTDRTETGPPDSCTKRLSEPGDPVPGTVFADCLVTATRLAATAHMTTTYPHSSATGPIRMGKPFELYLKTSDGGELFIKDERGWMKGHGSWTEAKANGSAQERLADAVVKSYLGFTDPRAQQQFLATTEWQPAASAPETVNGRQAVSYSGRPKFGDVTYDDYRVWIDKGFLPVRIVATVTVLGRTETGRQDYADWGKQIHLPDGLPQ